MTEPLKIALIGSAPSSVALAPYTDPSWKIWACSPGARPHVKRCDAWFELHLWEPEKPWFAPEYVAFMATLPCPVWMIEPVAAIPNSVGYPKHDIVERYGVGAVWFYTSSLSWMFAAAIAAGATEIGLWGVDMSAGEEIYTHQRAGCHYWIGKAMELGIKVTVPQQSDLMRPAPLYGFNEKDGMHQKLLVREEELNHRKAMATQQFEAARNEILYLTGAAEDVKYARQTFVYDRQIESIIGAATGYQPVLRDPQLDAYVTKVTQPAQPDLKVGDKVDMGGGVSCTIEEVVDPYDDMVAGEVRKTPFGTVTCDAVIEGKDAVFHKNPNPPEWRDASEFTDEKLPTPTAAKIMDGLGAMISGDHLAEFRTPVEGAPGTRKTVDEIKARVSGRWAATAVPDFIENV